jgi:hypothetical protein
VNANNSVVLPTTSNSQFAPPATPKILSNITPAAVGGSPQPVRTGPLAMFKSFLY